LKAENEKATVCLKRTGQRAVGERGQKVRIWGKEVGPKRKRQQKKKGKDTADGPKDPADRVYWNQGKTIRQKKNLRRMSQGGFQGRKERGSTPGATW